MLFRTELILNKSDIDINYQSSIAFLGSCFSENIGQKLLDRKFNVQINPFGTIYNPVSIADLIGRAIYLQYIQEDEIVDHNGLFLHHDFHSHFNDGNKEALTIKLNGQLTAFHHLLKHADFLFITPGTSWVYQLKQTNKIVSNCHKRHQDLFLKKLLLPQEIFNSLSTAVIDLEKFNPKLKIIFTLSPVRHIKDGIINNSISKAFLLQGIFEIMQSFINTSYFPSYEIMMDDLRDYRFYKEDLIHPTEHATQYIWDKLTNHFMSHATLKNMQKVEKINSFFNHIPERIDENYLEYKAKIASEIEALKNIVYGSWSDESVAF